MHAAIIPHHPTIHRPRHRPQRPMHQPMAPIRRTRIRNPPRTPRSPNLPQHRLHERARRRDQRRRAPHLAHGADDQVRLHQLHGDAGGRQLGRQRAAPVLQEGFGAGVGGEQRRRQDAAEGGHGEDEAVALGGEARGEDLGDAERGEAVDGDDVGHFGQRGLDERDRDAVAEADVVDEDGEGEV